MADPAQPDKIFVAPPAGKNWDELTYEQMAEVAEMLAAALNMQRDRHLQEAADQDDGTEPHSAR